MKKLELREQTIAVLFLIPAVVGLLLFYYYPIGHTLVLSAYDLNHTARS